MSDLVEHAKIELELLGEDEWLVEGFLKIVQDFADMGHSGSSAAHSIAVLERLLQFKNLTPLTDNPKEWHDVSSGSFPNMWQSTRDVSAFSDNGGKTYYFVEGDDPSVKHRSVHVEP
jgi:hypothetical protein